MLRLRMAIRITAKRASYSIGKSITSERAMFIATMIEIRSGYSSSNTSITKRQQVYAVKYAIINVSSVRRYKLVRLHLN